MTLHPFRLALFALALVAAAYLVPVLTGPREAPRIEHFVASRPAITSGEAVTLSWKLGGSAPRTLQLVAADETRAVTGDAMRLEPALSQVYTLVAQNRAGSEQRERFMQVRGAATPSGGAAPAQGTGGAASGGSGEETSKPEGSFGVSLSPDGPFVSDEASGIENLRDERIVRVPPGGEFFAEVSYRDPDGIAGVALNLVNSDPEGLSGTLSPDRPPFSVVGAPTGTCNLGQLPTAVRCLYRIEVAEDAQNIDALPGAGGEFAYVFRVRVSDGLGNVANEPVRGYVEVTEP